MFKTLLVMIFGFLPSAFSWWVIRKTQLRTRNRIRQAAINLSRRQLQQSMIPVPDEHISDRYYLEGVGYLVGDISCQYNARSGYIRCAVNPTGPCQGCRYYEPKEFTTREICS
ncbi:DUF6464 family protein [Richelia sinica]|nr:DUF6464 family protein [Richelia sinica]MBD2664615.1 hypothetical protein [Richelia sinica FACHB-800]